MKSAVRSSAPVDRDLRWSGIQAGRESSVNDRTMLIRLTPKEGDS
jgi:hypothetical protein